MLPQKQFNRPKIAKKPETKLVVPTRQPSKPVFNSLARLPKDDSKPFTKKEPSSQQSFGNRSSSFRSKSKDGSRGSDKSNTKNSNRAGSNPINSFSTKNNKPNNNPRPSQSFQDQDPEQGFNNVRNAGRSKPMREKGQFGQNRQGRENFGNNPRPARPARVQKTMDVDYNILVKKAKPQKIEEYTPSKTFAQHGLHPKIIESLDYKGYTQPTPIQDQAIPHIMQSKDIIGIANTGTGKTAAFLLPLIHQVLHSPNKCILILAPTRELTTQIHKELESYCHKFKAKISSVTITGGESINPQIKALRKPMNFIIATTGRGLDLIEGKHIKIREIDTIVLDEMDQMLDMGFIKDIRTILKLAVNTKHLLFFSATTTNEIGKIAMEMLNNPVTVSVVRGQTSDNVNQDVIEIPFGESKIDKLFELLSKKEVEKAIVFENTKHGSARIEKELNERGLRSLAIHGNKSQSQRTKALDSFKAGKTDILIATNVAARGLDIPLVSHVINYSLPQSKEDYIHRIGRTGRAGEVGQAWTFVTHEDRNPKPADPKAKKNKKAKARMGK
jgi:ATP-dependent RNA helicase RhlE